jgi:hypothetical protein
MQHADWALRWEDPLPDKDVSSWQEQLPCSCLVRTLIAPTVLRYFSSDMICTAVFASHNLQTGQSWSKITYMYMENYVATDCSRSLAPKSLLSRSLPLLMSKKWLNACLDERHRRTQLEVSSLRYYQKRLGIARPGLHFKQNSGITACS